MQSGQPADGRRAVDWGAIIFGLLIVGIGAYLFLKDTLKIAVPDITWDAFWPIVLIAIGAVVLIRALTGDTRRARRH